MSNTLICGPRHALDLLLRHVQDDCTLMAQEFDGLPRYLIYCDQPEQTDVPPETLVNALPDIAYPELLAEAQKMAICQQRHMEAVAVLDFVCNRICEDIECGSDGSDVLWLQPYLKQPDSTQREKVQDYVHAATQAINKAVIFHCADPDRATHIEPRGERGGGLKESLYADMMFAVYQDIVDLQLQCARGPVPPGFYDKNKLTAENIKHTASLLPWGFTLITKANDVVGMADIFQDRFRVTKANWEHTEEALHTLQCYDRPAHSGVSRLRYVLSFLGTFGYYYSITLHGFCASMPFSLPFHRKRLYMQVRWSVCARGVRGTIPRLECTYDDLDGSFNDCKDQEELTSKSEVLCFPPSLYQVCLVV